MLSCLQKTPTFPTAAIGQVAALGALVALGILTPACTAPAGRVEEGAIITDRPSFGFTPNVLVQDRLQVETGYGFARDSNQNNHSLPNTGIRYGLGDGVEARISTPGGINAEGGEDGFGDAVLGARFAIQQQDRWIPELSLQPGISIPVGDASGTDSWQPELIMPTQWAINPRTSLLTNIGVQIGTQDSTRETEVNVSASALISRTLSDRLAVFGEWFAVLPGGRQDQHSVDAGVTWLWSENLQLDAAAGVGITGAATDFFLTLGAAYRF